MREWYLVLKHDLQVFLTTLKTSKLCASYELWHTRLGHAHFDTISLLNKLGCLSFTSFLPKLCVCFLIIFLKENNYHFQLMKNVLCMCFDLVHCDLWGQNLFLPNNDIYITVYFVDDFHTSRGFISCR